MPLFSNPAHGEAIEKDNKATLQLHAFLEDLAELHNIDSLPDETEIIFNKGLASIQLATFLQAAAEATSLTPPSESEIILENSHATFVFQAFLDDLAA